MGHPRREVGHFALSTAASGGAPFDHDVEIPFDTPFPYDPSAGHLLLDGRNFSGTEQVTRFLFAPRHPPIPTRMACRTSWNASPARLRELPEQSSFRRVEQLAAEVEDALRKPG